VGQSRGAPALTAALETGLARARGRNATAEAAGDAGEGRFEAESLAFHERIRQGYLDWAARYPDRFLVVDAAGDPPAVAGRIWTALAPRLRLAPPA